MKFHITIKDNENNEILVDMDTNVIMGVVDKKDKCMSLCYTQCDGRTLMQNFITMQKAARSCLSNAQSGDLLWKMAMSSYMETVISEKDEEEVLH